jgi:hypothetical protein
MEGYVRGGVGGRGREGMADQGVEDVAAVLVRLAVGVQYVPAATHSLSLSLSLSLSSSLYL